MFWCYFLFSVYISSLFTFFQICLLPLPETYQGLQSWSYPWTIELQFLFHFEEFLLILQCLFSKAVIVLSSAKLYNEDFFIKPKRSFINISNNNGPRVDPCGTPESSVWNVLCMLFTLTYSVLRLNQNKRIRGTFCQNRTYLILQLVNREVCSQTLETSPREFPLLKTFYLASLFTLQLASRSCDWGKLTSIGRNKVRKYVNVTDMV